MSLSEDEYDRGGRRRYPVCSRGTSNVPTQNLSSVGAKWVRFHIEVKGLFIFSPEGALACLLGVGRWTPARETQSCLVWELGRPFKDHFTCHSAEASQCSCLAYVTKSSSLNVYLFEREKEAGRPGDLPSASSFSKHNCWG